MCSITKIYTNLSISNLIRCYSKAKIDPGINVRRKVIKSNDDLEDNNDFDDLESDFSNVNKTYKEHVTEIEAQLEKTKFNIVRQRYFKEKHINFLTIHDKEQIKYLYNSDPEEWTSEKLSESFPLLPEDVKKVVKANWAMKSTRMERHDKLVERNWEDFRNGKIQNLPKKMIDHLNKFTKRMLNVNVPDLNHNKHIIKAKEVSPIKKEFSEIITSYEKMKAAKECKDLSIEPITDTKDIKVLDITDTLYNETIQTKKNMKKNLVTLPQFKNAEKLEFNGEKDLSQEERKFLQRFNSSFMNNLNEPKQISAEDVTGTVNNNISLINQTENKVNHWNNPEKIIIPKDQRKKGSIYKLHDCFYDDGGHFLYKVPGMY